MEKREAKATENDSCEKSRKCLFFSFPKATNLMKLEQHRVCTSPSEPIFLHRKNPAR